MYPQKKLLLSGETLRWEIDPQVVAQKITWAQRDLPLLEEELRELSAHFPTFLLTIGDWQAAGEAWGGSGKLHPCRVCGGLLIFDVALRCSECRSPVEELQRPLLGVALRIPALIEGRPFHSAAKTRLAQLRAQNPELAKAFADYFLKVDGRAFFAPPIYVYFPSNWRKSDPFVMVRPDYFETLVIPPDHIYPGTTYRLCNYANWREVSLRSVLQQRIVPRIYIDLMVADLTALRRLDEALEESGISLHSLYNIIGKPEESAHFSEVYERILHSATAR